MKIWDAEMFAKEHEAASRKAEEDRREAVFTNRIVFAAYGLGLLFLLWRMIKGG
jgi:hypothetical protein